LKMLNRVPTQNELQSYIQADGALELMSNHKEEFYQQCVIDAYKRVLGREPDDAGLRDHVNLLLTGRLTPKRLCEAFRRSEECKQVMEQPHWEQCQRLRYCANEQTSIAIAQSPSSL